MKYQKYWGFFNLDREEIKRLFVYRFVFIDGFLFFLNWYAICFFNHQKVSGVMFRIRESFLDQETVCIWVDGRLSDRDLGSFREVLSKYLDLKMRVLVNLIHLTQMGWEVKQFLQKIRHRIVLVDLPEYLKSEIMNEESGDSEG